jgi:hypothetical protein
MLFWIAIVLLVLWGAGAALTVHEAVHVLLLAGLACLLLAFATAHDARARRP